MSRKSGNSRQLRGLIFLAACCFLAFFLSLPLYVRLQHCAYTEPNALLRRFSYLLTNWSWFCTLLFSGIFGISRLVKIDDVNRTKLSLVFFGPALFYLVLRQYPADGIWTFERLAGALLVLGMFLGSLWVVLIRPIWRPDEEEDKRDLEG